MDVRKGEVACAPAYAGDVISPVLISPCSTPGEDVKILTEFVVFSRIIGRYVALRGGLECGSRGTPRFDFPHRHYDISSVRTVGFVNAGVFGKTDANEGS